MCRVWCVVCVVCMGVCGVVRAWCVVFVGCSVVHVWCVGCVWGVCCIVFMCTLQSVSCKVILVHSEDSHDFLCHVRNVSVGFIL